MLIQREGSSETRFLKEMHKLAEKRVEWKEMDYSGRVSSKKHMKLLTPPRRSV